MATDGASQPEVTEELTQVVNGVEPMEQDEKTEEVDHDSREDKIEEQNQSKEDTMEEQTDKGKEEKEVQAQVSTGEKRTRKPSFKVLANEDFVSPFTDRTVRERKSVARLVASPEKESSKEFHIPKGHGTALKDIPRVAHQLTRKKNDDIFKMLHVILFGRQAKAPQLKSNLSQFSGFVWSENEEKQRLKMKEKLDKCVKEKLFEFCDVFDIPISKTSAKKEDVVTKLLDFLEAPHPESTVLHAEDGKLSTTKKRSRSGKNRVLEAGGAAAEPSSKKQKKTEEGNTTMEESDSESDASQKSGPYNELRKEEREKTEKSVHDGSEDEVADNSESKQIEHDRGVKSDPESKKVNQSSKKSSTKTSLVESKPKKVTIAMEETPLTLPKQPSTMKCPVDEAERGKDKEIEKSVSNGYEDEGADHSGSKKEEHDSRKKSSETTKKQNQSSMTSATKMASPVKSKPKKMMTANETPLKSPKKNPSQKLSKVNDSTEKSAIVFSRKKKNEAPSSKKSIPSKSIEKENDNKEQSGKKSLPANEVQMNEACSPTEQELRKAIGEILRELDLNKITFLDILKLLGQNFNLDLVPRKSAIKVMVKDELIKLNDEDDELSDEDEDDESDTEKVETPEVRGHKTNSTQNSTPGSLGNSSDREGRCIRSDGRKWRCSKDAMPGHKYCEHHLNRVRKR